MNIKTTILDYLEETVKKYPEKDAFADVNESITYGQLVLMSKAVGTALLSSKNNSSVIAFYTDKSVKTIVGFMGSVYAGCAYTHISLGYPAERVNEIISSISPCVIVTDRKNSNRLEKLKLNVDYMVLEDLISTEINEEKISITREQITDLDPLYINFTSGSTGKPKGVVIGHRSVIDFITSFTNIFNITEKDNIANQAPFDFDVSVKDIYSAIFTGATVNIVPTEYFIRPVELMDYICDRHTTIMIWAVSALCFVTSMNALSYRCPTELRSILFSGEIMPIKHLNLLKRYLPNVQYVNLYGPTEITCNCTYYIIEKDFGLEDRIPLGKPFPNTKVFLLNPKDELVTEKGSKGELCVSGTCLALGYYRDRKNTEKSFVQNPNNKSYNEIIYKTGDIIEIGEDGDFYYKTRKDFQIKHMGHRVELTEIEICIDSLDGVERSCCLFDEDKDRIIAVFVGTVENRDIISVLKSKLPTYMHPNVYYQIDNIPINKNGKINRKKIMDLYINNSLNKDIK